MYYLWTSVYDNTRIFMGYSRDGMLMYILIVSFLSDLIFSSRVSDVGAEILTGNIINQILKPVSFFKFLLTREIADKTINVVFSIIEISILVMLAKPNLLPPHSLPSLALSLVHLALGLGISYWFSFMLAMIAFWTAEIWAPRFIYLILVFVFAGNYFPIDILPNIYYKVLLLTPFPYFVFVPAQIYLKGTGNYHIIELFIAILWLITSYLLAKKLWKKGLKEYNFYGR